MKNMHGNKGKKFTEEHRKKSVFLIPVNHLGGKGKSEVTFLKNTKKIIIKI